MGVGGFESWMSSLEKPRDAYWAMALGVIFSKNIIQLKHFFLKEKLTLRQRGRLNFSIATR